MAAHRIIEHHEIQPGNAPSLFVCVFVLPGCCGPLFPWRMDCAAMLNWARCHSIAWRIAEIGKGGGGVPGAQGIARHARERGPHQHAKYKNIP